MGFVKVGSLSLLPPGELMEATVGGKAYAVCNVDGEVHVMEGTCPHLDGPLGHGALHGHMVVCPWHAWEFDCRTGANDRNSDVKVTTVRAQVEGDDILIDVG